MYSYIGVIGWILFNFVIFIRIIIRRSEDDVHMRGIQWKGNDYFGYIEG